MERRRRPPLPFSSSDWVLGPAQRDVDRGVECGRVVDDAGGECAGVCRRGFLRCQRDGEHGDGIARLEDRRGDGVDIFMVLAVVDGVAACPHAGEFGGQVAGVGEGARRVSPP
jgi:hypothetical protein